jgi:hypothetical protein
MLKSVEGIFRNGRVELLETPVAVEGARVVVTFMSTGQVDLADRGIDASQAADLRGRLKSFAPEWELPEMDVYDYP